jgi:hypothetical protein
MKIAIPPSLGIGELILSPSFLKLGSMATRFLIKGVIEKVTINAIKKQVAEI